MLRERTVIATLVAVCALVALPVRASLVGDEIFGSVTDLPAFSNPTPVVDIGAVEFETSYQVPDSYWIDFDFDFQDDSLFVDIRRRDGTGILEIPEFTLTFGDLDWDGVPDAVLTDVKLTVDDPSEALMVPFGQGVTLSDISDHAFTIHFDAYTSQEFRYLEFELEHGAPVVPVPAAWALGLLGMGGIALKRWFA